MKDGVKRTGLNGLRRHATLHRWHCFADLHVAEKAVRPEPIPNGDQTDHQDRNRHFFPCLHFDASSISHELKTAEQRYFADFLFCASTAKRL
jgi:hypothetical protein